jgi:hypothetical protein
MHNYCTLHIIKENFENFLIHRCNYILLSQVYCVWQVVKTLTIVLNNPVHENVDTAFASDFLLTLVLISCWILPGKSLSDAHFFPSCCYHTLSLQHLAALNRSILESVNHSGRQKLSAVYETRMLIAVFAKVCYSSLSWANWIFFTHARARTYAHISFSGQFWYCPPVCPFVP